VVKNNAWLPTRVAALNLSRLLTLGLHLDHGPLGPRGYLTPPEILDRQPGSTTARLDTTITAGRGDLLLTFPRFRGRVRLGVRPR
jgi:hypothetical protein